MSGLRKLGLLLLAGVAFGVLVAVVKGQDTGVRDALGNTSAPWVVVPFLAGARYRSSWAGAAAGVAATLAAFFGFYLAEAAVLDLGPHPWTEDLRLTLGSGTVYETWGLCSGSLYGAFGALWATRSLRAGAVAVGLAFVGEPLIVLALERSGMWGGGELLRYPELWLTEVLVGVAAIAYVLRRAPARPLRAG